MPKSRNEARSSKSAELIESSLWIHLFVMCVWIHIFVIYFAAFAARAETNPASRTETVGLPQVKVLLGMEIELEIPKLANIAGFFDYSHFTQQIKRDFISQMSDESLNAYLTDWAQFEKLPRSTQQQLVGDLEVPKVKLEPPRQKTILLSDKVPAAIESVLPPVDLLGPDGKPLERQVVIETSAKSAKEKRSQKKELDRLENEVKNQRRQNALAIVQQRWRELPANTKRALITVENLPDLDKAHFLLEALSYPHSLKVPILPSAPEPIKKLFERLSYQRDLNTVEFKHTSPLEDPKRYLRDLNLFSELAKISRDLNYADPNGNDESSYHLNISTPDRKDLTKFLSVYNHVLLSRLYKKGFRKMFGWRGYNDDIRARGLVRMKERTKNHFEVCVHTQATDKTLEESIELLSLPEEKAIERLANELAHDFTPEFATYLKENSPNAFFGIAGRILKDADPRFSGLAKRIFESELSSPSTDPSKFTFIEPEVFGSMLTTVSDELLSKSLHANPKLINQFLSRRDSFNSFDFRVGTIIQKESQDPNNTLGFIASLQATFRENLPDFLFPLRKEISRRTTLLNAEPSEAMKTFRELEPIFETHDIDPKCFEPEKEMAEVLCKKFDETLLTSLLEQDLPAFFKFLAYVRRTGDGPSNILRSKLLSASIEPKLRKAFSRFSGDKLSYPRLFQMIEQSQRSFLLPNAEKYLADRYIQDLVRLPVEAQLQAAQKLNKESYPFAAVVANRLNETSKPIDEFFNRQVTHTLISGTIEASPPTCRELLGQTGSYW